MYNTNKWKKRKSITESKHSSNNSDNAYLEQEGVNPLSSYHPTFVSEDVRVFSMDSSNTNSRKFSTNTVDNGRVFLLDVAELTDEEIVSIIAEGRKERTSNSNM